jgi:hypothetical protein
MVEKNEGTRYSCYFSALGQRQRGDKLFYLPLNDLFSQPVTQSKLEVLGVFIELLNAFLLFGYCVKVTS